MGNVLAVCEFQGANLRTSALSNLACAHQAATFHGGNVIAMLIGTGATAAAPAAAKYAPKVIVVDDPALAHYLAETYAPIVAREAKANDVSLVCATATSSGKD